jgi:hypothetical protein
MQTVSYFQQYWWENIQQQDHKLEPLQLKMQQPVTFSNAGFWLDIVAWWYKPKAKAKCTYLGAFLAYKPESKKAKVSLTKHPR